MRAFERLDQGYPKRLNGDSVYEQFVGARSPVKPLERPHPCGLSALPLSRQASAEAAILAGPRKSEISPEKRSSESFL